MSEYHTEHGSVTTSTGSEPLTVKANNPSGEVFVTGTTIMPVSDMTEYIIECDYDFDDGLIPGEVREEIVRCMDCKHAYEVTWPASSKVPPDYLDCGGPLVETWDYYNDVPKDNPVPPNGFCFYGERRDA